MWCVLGGDSIANVKPDWPMCRRSHLDRTQGLNQWLGKGPRVQAWMSDLLKAHTSIRGGNSLVCLCSGACGHCWCLHEWWKRPCYLCSQPCASCVCITGTQVPPCYWLDMEMRTAANRLRGEFSWVYDSQFSLPLAKSSLSFKWRLSAKYITVLLTQGREITSFQR